jgi:hypothetical protein
MASVASERLITNLWSRSNKMVVECIWNGPHHNIISKVMREVGKRFEMEYDSKRCMQGKAPIFCFRAKACGFTRAYQVWIGL